LSIQLLKLTTGEEILVTVTDETSHAVTVTDAVAVFPTGNEAGGLSLQFAPWTLTMFSDTGEATIQRSGILAECDASEEIVDRYNKMFGKVSIAIPSQKIILS